MLQCICFVLRLTAHCLSLLCVCIFLFSLKVLLEYSCFTGVYFLEEEMATHSSVLTCTIPWTEEPGSLQSVGSQRLGHDWALPIQLLYNVALVSVVKQSVPATCIHTSFLLGIPVYVTMGHWVQLPVLYSRFLLVISFILVVQLCLSLCDPTGCSTPGFPVLYYLLELAQTQVH